jgi:sugar lactone lactonase YvrE
MTISTATIKARGLHFGEGPRWHEGALVFSDMHARKVCRWREGERRGNGGHLPGSRFRPRLATRWDAPCGVHAGEAGAALATGPGALRCTRICPPSCRSAATTWWWMPAGGAYVGNFGFDLHGGGAPASTILCYVPPEGGRAVIAAEDLAFPNGTVITPDGKTLIIGESLGRRLTAFTIAAPGRTHGAPRLRGVPGGAPARRHLPGRRRRECGPRPLRGTSACALKPGARSPTGSP